MLGRNPPPHTPFNGDTFIGPEIKKLIERHKVQSIIETGTWSAHTTRELATLIGSSIQDTKVSTIDSTLEHLYEEFGPRAKQELVYRGIKCYVGDSSIDLHHLIQRSKKPILFYLDAHGGGANNSNVNPFLEELDQIARHATDSVIVIHDFYVPGKDFGHNGGDWGRGWEPLSYGLIESRLEKIYPGGHSYHYNEEANGCTRGVIYIYPAVQS